MSFQIFICLSLSLTTVVVGKSVRIVGGMDAELGEFPYMASFKRRIDDYHICGGALVSHWHVLTAAHCFYSNVAYSDILIMVGSNRISDSLGNSYGIENVFIHPGFTGTTNTLNTELNDIAVVKSNEFIPFGQLQNMIDLPNSDVDNGKVAIISGWGTTTYPSFTTSNVLQKTLMRLLKDTACSSYLPYEIRNDQFCGFNSQGIGVCVGDSGSPLVRNDVLIGIVSISFPCATGIPDLYTNVYHHLGFIEQYIYD